MIVMRFGIFHSQAHMIYAIIIGLLTAHSEFGFMEGAS